jgi:hypothetical protein
MVIHLHTVHGSNIRYPFLSIARVMRIDGAHQPVRKSGSLLGRPNMFFEPYQTSREAISVLRFLKKAVLPHDRD